MMENQTSINIKAINKEAVHRICSGQVVLNLAIAVKELVENSLDAGATVVEIRLREYGSELIEVTDNGSGVEPSNFQALTLKHHTSKLQDFRDLVSVETFGFRGEALSSLCSLSNLTVTTRHASCDCGSRLVFDHNGMITSSTSVARQVGTTVTLENIFSTLPVRHKEFHRNLKREFSKMSQLLYAYCLVSTGVKIVCTNQTKKGGRMTVASTQGCKTVRENIACVFGPKQLTSLLDVHMVAPSAEVLEQLNLKSPSAEEDFQSMFALEGLVSSCAHGNGRSASDRQFYYINSRPCEPSKVMKAVNEIYHEFNMHQQPFVFLNIKSARDSVDVNITPDKRQVFMEHEKLLVATIKVSLRTLYENIPSMYSVNNMSSASSVKVSSITPVTAKTTSSPAALLSQWRHSSTKRPSSGESVGTQPKQTKLDSVFEKKEKQTTFLNGFAKVSMKSSSQDVNLSGIVNENIQESNEIVEVIKGISSCANQSEMTERTSSNIISSVIIDGLQFDSSRDTSNNKTLRKDYESERTIVFEGIKIKTIVQDSENSVCDTESVIVSDECSQNTDSEQMSCVSPSDQKSQSSPIFCKDSLSGQLYIISESLVASSSEGNLNEGSPSDSISDFNNYLLVNLNLKQNIVSPDQVNVQYDTKRDKRSQQRTKEVNVTISYIRECMQKSHERKNNKTKQSRVRFRTVIDPTKNQQAEQELSREISKDMFSKMEIIGQFNLGFIITRLNSDLFIVDQHATDEKYNFETLQKTTTLSNQKLVVPQQLELTAVNEIILLENINIFKANGFEFMIDENAPATSKVKLTSIPISRNWTFGKEDIDELLFMLQDAPNTLCRPSRVRAMFASRACRKSVMIGTALSRGEMQRLITHMGEIEQPWNCPHGRPTMRHLINLDFI